MELKEDKHICPNCANEVTLTEAKELFEDGKIIGLIEDDDLDSVLSSLDEGKMKKEADGDSCKMEDGSDGVMKDGVCVAMKSEGKMKKEADGDSCKMEDGSDGVMKDGVCVAMETEKKESINLDDLDMSEDVGALFNGEDLSEEFKGKAVTIFESAVKSKIRAYAVKLEEAKEKDLEKVIKEYKEEADTKIDKYLTYVAEEWKKENKVALESTARTEMTDAFMKGLADLFKEHYIEVPEGRYDVLENMAGEIETLKTKLNEEINKNVEAKKEIYESKKKEVLADVSKDLADTEKEKLHGLVEDISYESEEQYRTKIETLKESYFNKKPSSSVKDDDLDGGDKSKIIETDNSLINGALKALKNSRID